MTVRIPPLDTVVRTVDALVAAGLTPAVGGSGLLVGMGLAEVANDWDVTVDADPAGVVAALDTAGVRHRDATDRGGGYATALRLVVDGAGHDVDVLVGFALPGPDGVEALPVRVTGHWRGLPLADPVVWERAYRLMGRIAKADALAGWLAQRIGSNGSSPGTRDTVPRSPKSEA